MTFNNDPRRNPNDPVPLDAVRAQQRVTADRGSGHRRRPHRPDVPRTVTHQAATPTPARRCRPYSGTVADD